MPQEGVESDVNPVKCWLSEPPGAGAGPNGESLGSGPSRPVKEGPWSTASASGRKAASPRDSGGLRDAFGEACRAEGDGLCPA